MKAQKLTRALDMSEIFQAFQNYASGASLEIHTAKGTEHVQVARMAWTCGKISLLCFVPDDKNYPYRLVHLNSMLEFEEADTAQKVTTFAFED